MKDLLVALRLFLALTIVTGVLYPAVVTVIGQAAFPRQASGSLIEVSGHVAGSELIGQEFSDPKYFRARPSMTSPFPYNAASSSGSNLGPTNQKLIGSEGTIRQRIEALRGAGNRGEKVPTELVTASGSGLDPHISPEAAEFQADRVAKARGMDAAAVRTLIKKATSDRTLGILGEPVVNVLKLNLLLDGRVP